MSIEDDGKVKLTVSCPCGKTVVSVHEKPVGSFFCHCTECHNMSQSAVVQCVLFPKGNVKVVQGSVVPLKRPDMAQHGHVCTECNCQVYMTTDKFSLDKISVSEIRRCNDGKLPAGCEPQMHIFYNERYLDVADDLPKFADLPEAFAGTGKLCNNDGTMKEA